MNKEIKDALQLLAMILPVFALVIIGWLHSPLYADIKAEDRFNARNRLIESYYFPDPYFDREKMMEDYGITDNEINPENLFNEFIKRQGNENNN